MVVCAVPGLSNLVGRSIRGGVLCAVMGQRPAHEPGALCAMCCCFCPSRPRSEPSTVTACSPCCGRRRWDTRPPRSPGWDPGAAPAPAPLPHREPCSCRYCPAWGGTGVVLGMTGCRRGWVIAAQLLSEHVTLPHQATAWACMLL